MDIFGGNRTPGIFYVTRLKMGVRHQTTGNQISLSLKWLNISIFLSPLVKSLSRLSLEVKVKKLYWKQDGRKDPTEIGLWPKEVPTESLIWHIKYKCRSFPLSQWRDSFPGLEVRLSSFQLGSWHGATILVSPFTEPMSKVSTIRHLPRISPPPSLPCRWHSFETSYCVFSPSPTR